jgi:hypothetical protein
MNTKRTKLGACALLIAVLGTGCATAQRGGTVQFVTPPTGDQANVSATGAQPVPAPAANPQHLSGMGVPEWWQTGALQSGDVMGTM